MFTAPILARSAPVQRQIVRMMNHDPIAVGRTEFHGEVRLPMLPSKRKAPLIELTIKGKKYHFLLDTGAQGSRVSPEVVAGLGLSPIGEVMAGDPSGKNSRSVKIYLVPKVSAGSADFYGVRMFADAGPTHGGGAQLSDGVLSYAVFKDLLLVLDYRHKQVILKKGALPASSLNYGLEHGLPTLPIQIGNVTVTGHVDSGADGGLSIPLKYKDQLPLAEQPRVIGHGRTLFNSVDIYGAKVKGPVKIGGMPVGVSMIEMTSLFPFGNIGGRVLQNYTVTIDQRDHRIQFRS